MGFNISQLNWKRLLIVTVTMNKKYLIVTVTMNKKYLIVTLAFQ